jgi:hypothetical protein
MRAERTQNAELRTQNVAALTRRLLIGVAVAFLPSTAAAQQETIVELISRGVDGRTRTAPSGRPPSLDTILSKTDVVVRGVVGTPKPRLAKDGRNVYSDYPLKAAEILYDSALAGSKRPGIRPEVTVTQLGGTITVGGGTYTQTELGLTPLAPGTDAIFLLQRTDNSLEIAGVFYGAFEVSNNRVRPLTSKVGFSKEMADVSAAHFIDRVLSKLRR